ncbi:proton-coupled zinc antiporter SLC30A2-like [Ruditapes philippinarum]|uniref:proton-coupled zinc antiporter SLC30A2-like n=1 Tax=Ruditapes philippinarum TaxID=129788 RepID=UPI00295A7ECA|nr:proton-coupled zinc antiporter SLC30A2-like [Ruditapes philippinarum]
MATEQELATVAGEDYEQFLMEQTENDTFIDENDDWHCHATTAKIPEDKTARNQLIAVSVLCFLFMVGEAIGGALSNSLALFTDVLHLGSDLISFLISLLSMYLAKKHATRNMSFGYHRAEVLGALFSVFIIWSVTGVLVYVAIERIIKEHYKDVKANEMLITATLGVVFNIVMGIVLHSEKCCGKSQSRPSFGHGHGHSHGSGHSHNSHSSHTNDNGYQRAPNHSHSHSGGREHGDYEPLLPDEENLQVEEEDDLRNPELPLSESTEKPHPKNINVRAAFIHVIGDIIQSMGVLLASIIIKLKPEEKYRLADPICTFLFSILVLFTTVNVLRDTLRIIMEGVPRDTDYFSIKQSLQRLNGVKAVHGLTVWCLTLEKNALAVHLAIDKTVTHQQVLFEASKVLKDNFNLLHTTIQVEDYRPAIMARCYSCQELKK